MNRRQQLILFALGLATLSTCTVAFAMAMSLGRRMAVSASPADRVPVAEATTSRGLAWEMPEANSADSAPQSDLPPSPTPPPTPTNTRVPTWTPSPTYTPTATRVPSSTPVPTPTHTPLPAPTLAPASEPTPAAPEPSPTPEFPYDAMVRVFDTGAPQMTRVTGMVWKIVDLNLAIYDGEAGYQMRMVGPQGDVHLSEVSGIGGADSTCPDCGDNQRMNMKIEFAPYVPGTYLITLVQGEKQSSPEVTVTLAADPQQYVHVNFIPFE